MAEQEKDTGSGWLSSRNAVTGLVLVDTVGLVALAWWTSSKFAEYESNQCKLTKKVEKLEKRVDTLTKQASKPDPRLKMTLDKHCDKVSNIEEDIENIQAKLESLIEALDKEPRQPKSKKPIKKKSKKELSSEDDSLIEDSESTQEELDSDEPNFDAIYAQEEKKQKNLRKNKGKKGR